MSDYSEAESAAIVATSITAGDTNIGASGTTAAGAGGMDNAKLFLIIQGALGGLQGRLHGDIDAEGARTSMGPGSNSISTSTTNGSAGGQRQ